MKSATGNTGQKEIQSLLKKTFPEITSFTVVAKKRGGIREYIAAKPTKSERFFLKKYI